jgi:hypothetical protein
VEFIVIELSVIAMVLLNGDSVLPKMLLAVRLGFQCLLGVNLCLAIDEVFAGELVDEYRGTSAFGMLELAIELRYESGCRNFELVHVHSAAWGQASCSDSCWFGS